MKKNTCHKWLIIGAGPAGIATVGKLLDLGVSKKQIAWMDPEFRVGDLGQKWYSVSSNTKVDLFVKFLHACKSFNIHECKESFPLYSLSPDKHCYLKEIAKPLQWVTDHISQSIHTIKDEALALDLKNGCWEVSTKSSTIHAENVVLCTGAEPKKLALEHPSDIPLEIALNPEKLAKEINSNDVVGVFGASHSAVLILANLLELSPKKVYNFYRSPHLYAVPLDDWILFDNTGLKGKAATWARANLEGSLPKNLVRTHTEDSQYEEQLSLCNKVVHSIGFANRKLPVIKPFPNAKYQETTGIIAPHLFGFGIAYPQAKFDLLGNKEYRVGLWKFMEYLDECCPLWLKYANNS
ncbi:MAG: hypothetical protein S4CHLAM37_11100 [Chlamydiia bacterium]|nr:hypothetical protein [Chlamydiia bacterium]